MSRGNAAQRRERSIPIDPAGVVVRACTQIGEQTQHGKPRRWRRVPSNQQTARPQAGPCRGGGEARSSDEAG